MINREDMLELTRRMNVQRNCFTRIAGAYIDEEGYIDGTFNTNFLNLSGGEKAENLEIAKTVPFAPTNKNTQEYPYTQRDTGEGKIRQLLLALRECGLKNDALMDLFYEQFSENFPAGDPYAVFLFHGRYDVPVKTADKERQWESEEVYEFLIGTVSPLKEEYTPDLPVTGFLYPSFKDRSTDPVHMAVFHEDGAEHMEKALLKVLQL